MGIKLNHKTTSFFDKILGVLEREPDEKSNILTRIALCSAKSIYCVAILPSALPIGLVVMGLGASEQSKKAFYASIAVGCSLSVIIGVVSTLALPITVPAAIIFSTGKVIHHAVTHKNTSVC